MGDIFGTYFLALPVGGLAAVMSLVAMDIFCGELFIFRHADTVFCSVMFITPLIIALFI